MADLPAVRVRQAYPFENTGCDYAGPLLLKVHKGRNPRKEKGYICLFVCPVTSAIHLELATDLSMETFLAIRSVKLHLRRVIWNSILTFEQMHTLLAQIESVVNSRPLFATSDTEVSYLSPAHLLIGRPYTSVPEGDLGHIAVNRLDYWQNVQAMLQGFWKRWHQEYLTTPQQRLKWNTERKNVATRDMATIKELKYTTRRLGFGARN
ncbi:uncharacterized protein [Drosophila takahashii]|uniref:uncharacterized protein n=1 Tax=Drosophila takahashii TaxID=29030 RepID=UPI003898DAE9